MDLIKETEENNQDLDELFKYLDKINCDKKSVKHSLKLTNFLPKKRKNFYQYYGSLTTPPCSESVTWIIFQERINIGREQVRYFPDEKIHDFFIQFL